MDRRAVKAEWKDRAPDAGVYAVRMGPTLWIGATMRLGAAEQRLRFSLKTGGARPLALQQAYSGEMAFEVLEQFEDDISQMARERLLKERLAHWVEKTGGIAL
ncbi:GIY-YIG nuclease family protein [Psychromarinibacter sp. S121]|uniref:GIY-YIG nuclease family protein n=1 Tax=Psychromarinibacter sp. S121 TaxID=3415127 RepID=UPI003C7BC0D6